MTRCCVCALLFALLSAGCSRVLELSVGGEMVPASALEAGTFKGAQVIDLRGRDAYAAGHLPGARSVPFLELDGALQPGAQLGADTRLLLVAETDTDALLALPTVRLHRRTQVAALAGGMERWRAERRAIERGPGADRASSATPIVELSRIQQAVAFLSGGVIKPAYMILAIFLVLRLRRAKGTALRLLWHGLLWFFIGEAFCAVNFYLHAPGRAHPIDLLHGVGMVAMSALIPWGLFRLLDDRVLHFGDPAERCQVQRLCGRCWKRDRGAGCGPHDLMMLLVLGLAVLALMPLSSDLRPTLFTAQVFGAATDYGAPILNHLVELRLYPVIGAALLLLTALRLRGGPASVRRSEPFFFLGLGFVTYPLLRHLLINAYRDALWWSDLWEEATELLMVLAVGVLLFVLRRQLGLTRADPAPAPSGESEPVEGEAP